MKNLEKKDRRKAQAGETILFLSTDLSREVLLIKSSTCFGTGNAEMKKFQPAMREDEKNVETPE